MNKMPIIYKMYKESNTLNISMLKALYAEFELELDTKNICNKANERLNLDN